MRIISSFHDYYDISLAYGYDPSLIYKRETIEYNGNEIPTDLIVFPISSNKEYRSRSQNLIMSMARLNTLIFDIEALNPGLVLFCGEVIPFVEAVFQFQNKTIYDKNELLDSIQNASKKKEWEKLLKLNFPLDRISKYFNIQEFLHTDKEFIVNKHLKASSPIMVQRISSRYQGNSLIINPKLKNIDFYKTIDPYTAYQEISMFIGNYFGKPGNEMVEIDDNTRAEMHGFDKNSFRKSPTKKNKQ